MPESITCKFISQRYMSQQVKFFFFELKIFGEDVENDINLSLLKLLKTMLTKLSQNEQLLSFTNRRHYCPVDIIDWAIEKNKKCDLPLKPFQQWKRLWKRSQSSWEFHSWNCPPQLDLLRQGRYCSSWLQPWWRNQNKADSPPNEQLVESYN